MFERVQSIIAEELGINPNLIKEDTNLKKDLDADSLDAVEIIMALEDEFEIELPDEEIEGIETVTDLMNLIEKHI